MCAAQTVERDCMQCSVKMYSLMRHMNIYCFFFYKKFNYPNLYILGAAGYQRRQIQFFNKYDPCCFEGTKGKIYEKSIKETLKKIGDGKFNVYIDSSHGMHKVSQVILDIIHNEINPTNRRYY